jgi:hypothetical protein
LCVQAVAVRAVASVLTGVALSAAARPAGGAVDVVALLARVGEQVEQYFARAQRIVCQESVRLQSLSADLMTDGSQARQLVYELRMVWDPPSSGQGLPEATVLREIITIDGRPPRPKDEPGCMDPKPVSPEPLAMLLPARQRDYAFTWAGTGRADGRPAAMLDYKSLESGPVRATWRNNCVNVDLPGRTRGRVWIDQATGDVLRLDERLTGMFDIDVPLERRHGSTASMTIERADSSIRYKRVAFRDPEEAFLVPASIDTLTVIRNAGAPRVRKTQVFSNYRRYVTDWRIVQ